MEKMIMNPHWINVSEIEILYKPAVKPTDRPAVKTSQDAYRIFLQLWDDNKMDLLEQCKVMLLNRSSRVLGVVDISTGGIHATVVDTKIILAAALKAAASKVCLCHNHPSANLTPSPEDKKMTDKIVAAATYMDIEVIDHIILSRYHYFSFADEGLLS